VDSREIICPRRQYNPSFGNPRYAPPNACTSETQKLLEVLAATLRSLSEEDRARLAELLEEEEGS